MLFRQDLTSKPATFAFNQVTASRHPAHCVNPLGCCKMQQTPPSYVLDDLLCLPALELKA